MTKTLYVYDGSVWVAVAKLAIAELGYKSGDIAFKSVNLFQGENYNPSFLKLNPNGTLPTLEADGEFYTSTKDVIARLIKDSTVKVAVGTSIIETVHEERFDPNFAMLLSRNDEELTRKTPLAGALFSGRQAALEKYSKGPDAGPFKAFYETKLAENGAGLAVFTGKASAEHKAGFFAKSQAHFASIKSGVLEVLPGFLPESGFIGGAAPGEDDFHVGGWLARIARAAGGKSVDDALAAFERAYGEPVPAKVAAYWGAWAARPSWKSVYADGLQ
ncbi:hypothetical protein B0H11DRAFT_2003594 [Mycena galericulata]|nr:hypothetical protein B0H11DRAFT_2003594 [Mycena galericulata]